MPQINLLIQCNPYKNPKGFCRNLQANSKIHYEKAKALE